MAREATQLLYDAIINHFKRFNFDRKYTTAHFLEQAISLRLIQRVLQRFNNEENVRLRPIPGRPSKVVTPKLVSKIKQRYIKKPSSSERQVADFYKVSRSAVQRCKKKAKIISRKRRKAPLYNDN